MKIKEILNEVVNDQIWYHGTPDGREFKEVGGFGDRFTTIDILKDVEGYYQAQNDLERLRTTDEDAYFDLLDRIPTFKESYKFTSPIFLTNNRSVASTYTDANRSIDYQGAEPGVFEFKVDPGDNAIINGNGARFRFINVDKVRSAFLNAGVDSGEFEKYLASLNFMLRDRTKIMTDMIAALGSFFNFDYIDIIGILDSYEDGGPKSTVRMVLNKSLLHKIN